MEEERKLLAMDLGAECLEHYGILGQKWGVRRYQNEDGTLTKAGKKRERNKQRKSEPSKFAQGAKKALPGILGVGGSVAVLAAGYKYASKVLGSNGSTNVPHPQRDRRYAVARDVDDWIKLISAGLDFAVKIAKTYSDLKGLKG